MVFGRKCDDARVGELENARDEVHRAVEYRVDQHDLGLSERGVRPGIGDRRHCLDVPDPVESIKTRQQSLAEHSMRLDHHDIRGVLAHMKF